MLTYWALRRACWYTPRAAQGPSLTESTPSLCLPEPDYSLLASRLKPLPSVTTLSHPPTPHSTGFCCSQTQSAHLAPNQTIPKIDKQLWVRMDVQMGGEGRDGKCAREEGRLMSQGRSVHSHRNSSTHSHRKTRIHLGMAMPGRAHVHWFIIWI